jgi:tetratricopeptide (TPR) repeat protein
LGLSVLLALGAAGCAAMKTPKISVAPVPDVAEPRHERNEKVIEEFEARRDFAEYQAALGYWHREDFEGCEATLSRLLHRNPGHLAARLLAAEVCLHQDRRPEAVEHLDAALEAHPRDPRALHAKGLVLDTMDQSAGALVYYEQAMELAPEEELFAVSYHTALESFEEAARPADAAPPGPRFDVGLPVDAGLATASDLAGRDDTGSATVPEDPLAALAFSLQPSAGGKPEPVGLARRADRANGEDRAAQAATGTAADLLRRGAAALAEGSPDAALVFYEEAVRLNPDDPNVALSAAVESLRHNHPDLAVELLSPLQGSSAHLPRLPQTLGIAYYRLGDYRSAQVSLQQALSLDRSHALTYLLMGCTLAKLGQPESAEAHFRQARTLDPRYDAAR